MFKLNKMKKTNIFSLLILIIFSVSCTDLEEDTVSILSPDGFFKSADDVQAAINGAYGRMAHEAYYGRKLTLSLMLAGDMCDIGDRNTAVQRQEVNDFTMSSTNGMINAIWGSTYEIISALNNALNGAELVKANMTEDEYYSLTAEARFVRAFVYFHIVQLVGDIPYIDEFITDPSKYTGISKTSEDVVYDNIIKDLEYAIEGDRLPMQRPDGARSKPSKGSACTLLAAVHLTLGNWQEAYNYAKWVIDNKTSLDYDLTPDYQDLLFEVTFIRRTRHFYLHLT